MVLGRRRDVWNALRLAAHVLLAVALASAAAAVPDDIDYDIVYVRQPRFGDNVNTTWPEVAHPASIDPGADLMLRHADGGEEMLVAGGNGAVTDPFVSFDGQWVYYSFFYDVRQQAYNYQRGLPYLGADIFRIHIPTRAIEQLTFGEFTPNTGAGHFDESNPVNPPGQYDRLGYGILNLGPAPVAGGRIAFSSNRNGFVPPRGLTNPTLQLFVMDEDGGNVTQIAPMNIGSALHPTPLQDGRLLFSSLESQGLRDGRMWGIWSIWPDGRHWQPAVSAFRSGQAFHFMTQLSGGDLVVVDYYNLNNNGFGALYRLPVQPPAGTPAFHSAFPEDNPPINQTVGGGFSYPFRMPFTPWGMQSITPFTHGNDEAAPVGAGSTTRVGKFTHPSGAPRGDLLVVWSPGPCNDLDRPTTFPEYDAGLYLMKGGNPITNPNQLILIKNDPAYNEAWPRAVVSYRAVHGVDAPAELPWLPNDGTLHPALPAGTPYGLVGTSSVYKRESFPGFVTQWSDTFDGLDVFNTFENDQSSNWTTQGSDAGKYGNSDIWAIRIVGMEPNTHRSYGPNGGPSGGSLFASHAAEKLRILGEVPLRKFGAGGQPLLDAEGNPDTSFLVKIPADTPFTFQTLDRNGMLLNMAQTWHQVRPGEVRSDCGGCHAHSQQPLPFAGTYAASPSYQVPDLSKTTPLLSRDAQGLPALRTVNAPLVHVEFYRDIRPLLQRSCVPCHTKSVANPPGALVLDDYTAAGGLPGDYARLAHDAGGQWGYPSLVQPYGWRQTNASRYIRQFQSRRSLLMWKIYGARLDGWTNTDHPTESVPGNASTLPAGASVNEADLDFTGTAMPPPGSGVPPLTEDEKMTFARWIDLGAPINWGNNGTTQYGWFLDDLRPSLNVSEPRAGINPGPLTHIRLGAADAHTGVDWSTLSIKADFSVNGRAPGAPLADLAAAVDDGIYAITLTPPLQSSATTTLRVEVADHQGNITRVARRFSVQAAGTPPPTPPGGATPSASPSRTSLPASSTATATRTSAPPTATMTRTRTATRTRTPTSLPTAASATATPTPGGTAPVNGSIRYYRGDRPVAGIAIGGATSSSGGGYTVTGEIGTALTLAPQRTGGANGAISALDAAYVLQMTAGQRPFDATQMVACDASGNGTLSPLDATLILKVVVGLIPRLPVCELCASDWMFVPEPAPGGDQSTVAPSLQGGVCHPGAISFNPLRGAAAQQDFRAALFGDCTANWQPSAPPPAAARLRGQGPAVRLGKPSASSRRLLRLPIVVTGETSALQLTLHFDPTALRLRDVRLRERRSGALLAVNRSRAGSARIAVASSGALRNPQVIAVFQRLTAGAPPAVTLASASAE